MSNLFYEIPINVIPGNECALPKEMNGAYVNCYAGAENVNDALQKSVNALKIKGYIFSDILESPTELDLDKWEIFVNETWSEIADSLPTQSEVKSIVSRGGVFFGPFVGYSN